MTLFLSLELALVAVVALWMTVCTIFNALHFRSLEKKARAHHLEGNPLVSILIPARDEEEHLPHLLDSLLSQSYRNIEILIADDQSEDRTWEIIQSYEKKDPRVRGFQTQGKQRKSPHGKINALLILEPEAKGKYLLCTDADTWEEKESVEHALSMMELNHADILSGFPAQHSKPGLTSIITSAMVFSSAAIPHFFFAHFPVPRFAIGIGQFIMMKKESYEEVGGYEAVPDKICDDLGIIKLFMRKGKKYVFTNLSDDVHCTMYEDAASAFRGIERSLNGVFPYNFLTVLLILLVIVVLLLIFWAPLLTPLYLLSGEGVQLALLLFSWCLCRLAWYRSSRDLRFPFATAFCSTLAVTFICLMYLDGTIKRILGIKFVWKGRRI